MVVSPGTEALALGDQPNFEAMVGCWVMKCLVAVVVAVVVVVAGKTFEAVVSTLHEFGEVDENLQPLGLNMAVRVQGVPALGALCDF